MPVYSTKRCGCLLQQYLLRILLQFCASERMILPAYTTVQKTSIGKAITAEENRLVDLLHTHLTFQDRAALAGLFEKRDGRYRLTYLQQAPKDLGHSQLRQERDRGAELLPFYELATRILPCLAISHGVVLQLFTDDQIPPELPFTTLQERAFALLERERLIHTATYMTTGVGCDETACFWQAIDTMARRFKGRLRPLLSGVRLTGSQGQSALMEAVAFLQDLFARDRSLSQVHAHTIPTRCIPVHLKRYLYTRSVEGSPQLLRDRYEFLVYQLLRAALEAGDVFCRQSMRFRSIAELISAHDHESQWVFDLPYNDPTDIQPSIHSTDTHGTNQVNFALLKVFGYTFAPRYANIQEKVRTALYGFQHPQHYGSDALFRSVRKLNTALIFEQWDELQRIFVSLARKTTTQHVLISKLSSAKRRNRVLQALWEYDHIYRSAYLLEFIDSPQLRQNVQQALNRGSNITNSSGDNVRALLANLERAQSYSRHHPGGGEAR
jgi:hypothetical protein